MLHFNKEEIEGMIVKYYEECENKKVVVKVVCGKVRSALKYHPQTGHVHFDVREEKMVDGELRLKSIDVDWDDVKRMIGVVLEMAEFKVDNIEFTVAYEDPTVFTGMDVSGEKMTKEKKI